MIPDSEMESLAQLYAADRIARIAHYGQLSKYDNQPYILHVERVATTVTIAGTFLRQTQARTVAWLHDVVEDCEWFGDDPEHRLAVAFSEPVVEAVLRLTRGWYVARRGSYGDYIQNILDSGNELAVAVKIADLRDNMRPSCPPDLRSRYEWAHRLLTEWERAAR